MSQKKDAHEKQQKIIHAHYENSQINQKQQKNVFHGSSHPWNCLQHSLFVFCLSSTTTLKLYHVLDQHHFADNIPLSLEDPAFNLALALLSLTFLDTVLGLLMSLSSLPLGFLLLRILEGLRGFGVLLGLVFFRFRPNRPTMEPAARVLPC